VRGQQRAATRFSLGKQILFSAIIVGTLLLLAEGSIRIWALFFRTSYERYNARIGRLELVPNIQYTNASGHQFVINSRGFVGPEFDQHPPADVHRIIAVGDSCTFSGGFWRLAYPGILEHYLNAAAGRKRFEVINAGIEGYNSTFARQRTTQELIDYRPQLVLLYIGWNDLMKVDPHNAQAVGRYAALASAIETSYLARAYRKLMFLHLRRLVFQPKVGVDPVGLRAYDRFTPAVYQENLLATIRTLEQQGIRAMLVTLPTVVRPDMTHEELEKEHVFFPYFAGTYSVSEFLSLHAAYNRVVHAVGATTGVPVVDLDDVFNRRDKDGLFWDTMHPSTKGHCVIARELYGPVARMFGLNEPISGEEAAACR
jgi:lysophospholipase L1-like esterase